MASKQVTARAEMMTNPERRSNDSMIDLTDRSLGTYRVAGFKPFNVESLERNLPTSDIGIVRTVSFIKTQYTSIVGYSQIRIS